MSIKLHISPRIMSSIASLYNDVNRIFLEYIDNSIDSADDNFYDPETNSYTKPIEIVLKMKGDSHKDGKVIITDNCFGITNLPKVVNSIGDSDKKAQAWTNGQFGYGIYSFLATCGKLEIASKLKNEQALYIPIYSKQFDEAKQDDVLFPDPKIIKKFEFESGTKILLSDFDKSEWKHIDLNELKSEVEKHFERLLMRKNISIKLIGNDEEEMICKPFNYDDYEGEVYETYLKSLKFVRGIKKRVTITETPDKPIHIYLKIIKDKNINRPPVFISKGRRIAGIQDIKAFNSNHKSDLWGHPNIIGYVDTYDYLDPTIARTAFKNTSQSRALFESLKKIEPEILEKIKDINKESESRHYQELEDKLNSVLSKLARIDAMNYRTEFLAGKDRNLMPGGAGGFDKSLEGNTGDEFGNGNGSDGGDIPGGPGGNIGGNTTPSITPGEGPSDKEADNPFEDTGFTGSEKKKSGFNIRIVDVPPPTDEKDNQLRSQLVGGEIRIFKNHPDFIERVEESRRKEKRITQRLITYIAGEITVHYKDMFYTKHGQPEYNKNMFSDLVDFIYMFESALKDLAGKNLSDLT